jgi:hypothetical protein
VLVEGAHRRIVLMARQGKLVLPAPEDAVEFAAVIVDPPVTEPPPKTVNRPEIVLGPVTIRLDRGAQTRTATMRRQLLPFSPDLIQPRSIDTEYALNSERLIPPQ